MLLDCHNYLEHGPSRLHFMKAIDRLWTEMAVFLHIINHDKQAYGHSSETTPGDERSKQCDQQKAMVCHHPVC